MKRKLFTLITLTLCVLMAVLCLTACGNKGDDAKANQTTAAEDANKGETKEASALLGTWSANEAEGCAYTFEEDGKGVWDAGEGMLMNFTYADKGETVEITYEGASTTQIWEYTIDGDNLTMKDADTGSILTYTKK